MSTEAGLVRVGVGCFVLDSKGEKFITGIRKGSHGSGCIQLPGGHLELGESFEQCVEREVLEETGINLSTQLEGGEGIKFLTCTNDIFENSDGGVGKHYVTVFMVCKLKRQGIEPKVMEPDKCQSWQWTSWGTLVEMSKDEKRKENLFLPLRNLIQTRPEIDPTKFFFT
ncbi:hypothetical protein JCM5350_005321 [Sporobolomyces pararoseus]